MDTHDQSIAYSQKPACNNLWSPDGYVVLTVVKVIYKTVKVDWMDRPDHTTGITSSSKQGPKEATTRGI